MPPVETINVVGLAAVVLSFLTVLIPVAGLTLRYAIKPVVEALRLSRQASAERDDLQLIERRVALLEQELHSISELRADVVRTLEELEFQRQLKLKN